MVVREIAINPYLLTIKTLLLQIYKPKQLKIYFLDLIWFRKDEKPFCVVKQNILITKQNKVNKKSLTI
jgi:hypothetical protein